MSTTHFPPSTKERSTGIAGFTPQSPYDPLLSVSPVQEEMTQIRPDLNPCSVPTEYQPAHKEELVGHDINGLHWQNISSSTTHQKHQLDDCGSYPQTQPQVLSSYQDAYSVSPHAQETPETYNSTSPTNDCLSDFEYQQLNDYGAQDFDSTFLLEADFGPLTIPDDNQDLTQDTATSQSEEPASATSATSHAVSYGSRRSTGIATLSSHLMSPSLTETTSPGSGTEAISPIMKTRLLGGGSMSRFSSQSTATDPANSYDSTAHAQNTPALTGSSVEATPEPPSRAGFVRNASPVVRIESYSRGDSPARVAAFMRRSGSKRSRASRSSSHLAAPCEDSSEEGDQETLRDRSRSLYKPNALGVSNIYHDVSATRTGVDPSTREQLVDGTVLNFKEQDEQAALDVKNAEVSKWLAISEAGSETEESIAPPIGIRKYTSPSSQRRAKITRNQRKLGEDSRGIETAPRLAQSARIPGPNVLLDEESGIEEEDEITGSYVESAPASVDGQVEASEDHVTSFGNVGVPLQPQDAYPWVDPLYLRSLHDQSPSQPPTANAAMMRFINRAADIETASRAATWGTTTRRLSEADLDRMIGQGGLFSRLSVSRTKSKDQSDRRGSFLEQVEHAASRFIPKRSTSHLRRKTSEPIKQLSGEPVGHEYNRKDSMHARKESLHGRKESLGSRTGSPSISTNLRRIPSIGRKPKSPMINTGSAVAAVATQIATLGGNGSISPTAASSPTGPWSSARNALKRTARGDFHRPSGGDPAQLGIADLWNKQGGPPLPSFTSPPEEKGVAAVPRSGMPDEGADSDEIADDKGVAMDFTPRNDHIIPTYDGFKLNVRDINPRLAPYLVERIGQEQLRRFKKLVEFKVKHVQANQLGNCPSGSQCPDKGGVPTYFPSKSSQREPRLSHTGFSTILEGELDEDEEAVADGVVTAAQFPPGVPMPPVKRLPAQFECPLCFIVKKYQKPSDWSKHVHEDLQPFTCTFPTCPDPKSFKRKADWVRHENERHRQLEWWRCTEDGCSHQCYRRDNFVQHLVREHKMPEPKAKNAKPNKPAVRGPAKAKARASKETNLDDMNDDRVLMMIETCRHETPKSPSNEPCRFCGNMCSSWKKLTVHLARHMEQISMPVLQLVKERDVTADTIISPIEPRLPTQTSMSPIDPTPLYRGNGIDMSPRGNQRGVNVIKHELPGSFTPLQGPVVFQAPNYEDQATGTFPWGQPSSNGSHMHSHLSQVGYNRGTSGTYLSSHMPYQESESTQFITPNGPPGFVPTSSMSHPEDIYGSMAGQTGQIPQSSYAAAQSFPLTADQQALYTNQYLLQNGPNVLGPRQVLTNRSVPMQYAMTGSLPFTQAPTDPSSYPTQQQQQQFYSYPI